MVLICEYNMCHIMGLWRNSDCSCVQGEWLWTQRLVGGWPVLHRFAKCQVITVHTVACTTMRVACQQPWRSINPLCFCFWVHKWEALWETTREMNSKTYIYLYIYLFLLVYILSFLILKNTWNTDLIFNIQKTFFLQYHQSATQLR